MKVTQKLIKVKKLNRELEKDEKSGFLKKFNRSTFLKDLNEKYINSKS